jgi:Cu/Ag efflux pump CusA
MNDDPVLASLARLEAGTAALSVDFVTSMTRLESKLTGIRDDIGINMAGTERAQEAAHNTRSELHGVHEQMTVMWRQIKRPEQRVREITGES